MKDKRDKGKHESLESLIKQKDRQSKRKGKPDIDFKNFEKYKKTGRKMGQPSKLTETLVAQFELAGYNLLNIKQACLQAGISSQTYNSWRRTIKKELEETGKIKNSLERKLYHAYQTGQDRQANELHNVVLDDAKVNPKMALSILERKFSDDWSMKQKQEVEVISTEVVHNFEGLTDDEKREMIKSLKADESEDDDEE